MYKNKDVQRLNGLQIVNADQYVFFGHDNMETKVRMRYEELKDKIRNQKVDITYFGTSFFCMSPSAYNYNLERLSFLKHKNTDEESGVRDIRKKEEVSKFIESVLKKEVGDMNDFLEFLGLEA